MGHASLAVPTLTDAQRTSIGDVRSPYSPEDRIAIAMAFVVEGGKSTTAAAKSTLAIGQEVKAGTIRQWVMRAPWWEEAVSIARRMLRQELANKYVKILHSTEAEMADRIANGNTMIVNGEQVLVPVPLRELATTHGIVSDKLAQITGEALSTKEMTGKDLILSLAEELHKLGSKKAEKTFDIEDGEYERID